MTTDELERDLKTLAEPQEADERLRLAIRAQLGERCRYAQGAVSGPVSRSERQRSQPQPSQWRA